METLFFSIKGHSLDNSDTAPNMSTCTFFFNVFIVDISVIIILVTKGLLLKVSVGLPCPLFCSAAIAHVAFTEKASLLTLCLYRFRLC